MKLREIAKYYIGSYPEWLVTENSEKAFGANVFDLPALIRKISIASVITSALVSVVVCIISLNYTTIIKNVQLTLNLNLLPHPLSLNEPFNYALAVLAAVLTYLTLTPTLTNLILKSYLSYTHSVRKEKIDREMYSLLLTFLGFARSNLPMLECVKEVTKSELGEEIRGEFSKIYNLVAFEGKSLRTAMLEVASTTPSKQLAEFLRELAGVLEATRDIVTYIENKLASMNITRSIELNVYLEKLRAYSEAYLLTSTLLSLLVVLSGVFKIMSRSALSPTQVQLLVVIAFPCLGLILALLIHVASPEKEFKKKYGDIANALVGIIFAITFASIFVNMGFGLDYRVHALVAGMLASACAIPILERRIKFESGFDRESLQFLNRLAALLESRTMSRALQAISWRDFYFIRDHVRSIIVLASKGDPLDKVWEWSHKNAPTFMSSTISLILSKAVMSSSRILDVVHNIIREFHNYQRYRETRASITKTVGSVILLSFVLVCIILWLTVTSIYVPLANLKTPTSSQQTPFTVSGLSQISEESKSISLSMMLVLLAVTPLCITSIDGDVRKFFRYYLILSVVTLLIWSLIASNVNPLTLAGY